MNSNVFGAVAFFFLFVLLISGAFANQLIDDFEDGDYTSNPTWTVGAGTYVVNTDQAYHGIYSLHTNTSGSSISTPLTGSPIDKNFVFYIQTTSNSASANSQIAIQSNATWGTNQRIAVTMQNEIKFYNVGSGETGSGVAPTTGIWYTVIIQYRNGASSADSYVFDSTGTTLIANALGKAVTPFTVGYIGSYSDWTNTYYIDYIHDGNYIPPAPQPTTDFNVGFNYNIDTTNFKIDLNAYTQDINIQDHATITDWNWLINGQPTGINAPSDQNTYYSPITQNTDYNACIKATGTMDVNGGTFIHQTCQTIHVERIYGLLHLTTFDDTTGSALNYVNVNFNGLDYNASNELWIDLNNLPTLVTAPFLITMTRTGYTSKSMVIDLNRHSDVNYAFAFIPTSNTIAVNFQVFDNTGNYSPNNKFYAYDYSINKYIDIQTTDSLGRVTFNLNQTKSDYNFFSSSFNFGTTVWTINKPKDATTLNDITGNWMYSITGASYSSGTNISAGITKLLLQNTVSPYYITIQDVNEDYAPTTFGLISVTSELTKTLDPYLYPLGSAQSMLIKLMDFATNQPIPTATEMDLFLYTDSNGLIQLGTFVNDSTGTYRLYMDTNARYRLGIDGESYTLNPAENVFVYWIYITRDVGIIADSNNIDVNIAIIDLNFPIIFNQLREYAFGCNANEDNCYSAMIFALITLALALIVFVLMGQISPISQSIMTGMVLGGFAIIGFIPLWLFGIGVVVLIAWGIFT